MIVQVHSSVKSYSTVSLIGSCSLGLHGALGNSEKLISRQRLDLPEVSRTLSPSSCKDFFTVLFCVFIYS